MRLPRFKRARSFAFLWMLPTLGVGLLAVSILTAGCQKTDSGDDQAHQVRPFHHLKKGAANAGEPSGNGRDRGRGNGHQYGRPVPNSNRLPWEKEALFLKQQARLGSKNRMAAFQTTLPDPLPGEEANVALGADLLAGQTIKPGTIFSLNRQMGPYRPEKGYRDGPAYIGSKVIKTCGGGVCKIASTLYNAVILADVKVLERHAHGMQVPYVPPGQDATVAEGFKDFRFLNNTPGPLLIWADTRGNTLYLAIYGTVKPPRVTWFHQVIKRWPTQTVYRPNPNLKPGITKVAVPGAEGLIVRSGLQVQYPDGRVERRDLGTHLYQPLPRVVETNP